MPKSKQSLDYGAPKKECAKCLLRPECTKNQSGRTVKRHLRQDELDLLRDQAQLVEARRDLQTRQHLMERSFTRSKRYGYDGNNDRYDKNKGILCHRVLPNS
ncbi:MAG: hypothetical protein DDT42_00410 [candidate division WS2 bacterium]|uniref:Transposase DDE domain-containing protein n=1 Tax=Psychracetigena formicireducens TaxID=2986056 RepID=A0A9E2F6G6_PSYF1|nr:hypothetical protein [Candidatus Psychracetigena formicireducens]MBT9144568.1 hypothetical protein [Candidatus Psychracetigena formicireducens]